MSEINLPVEITTAAMAHMNLDHQKNLLAYARVLAGASWAETAVITALDAHGFELLIEDGNGRQETHTILFPQPAQDATQLETAFILLAEQADPPDGIQRVATAHVPTPKASRYLKALCNHFDRKAIASYDDHNGRIQFAFGECTLQAADETLLIRVVAESDTMFTRVKHVVADHLVRFGHKEELLVNWVDTVPAA